jgi:hypothetical protein
MRRITSFIGIMLLALLASGWSNVLASALCRNMQTPDCCLMKTMHDPASSHEAMAMDDMAMTMPAAEGEANQVGQPMQSCAHCLSSSNLPAKSVLVVNSVQESKPNLGAAIAALFTGPPVSFSPSFTPAIFSRQHAPPGTSAARHVLINVFLI